MFPTAMNGWQSMEQDSRRARRWLVISVIIHLPLTPLGPLFGLLALLSRQELTPLPLEDLRGIPVELIEAVHASPVAPAPEPAAIEPVPYVEPLTLTPAKPKRKPITDAGIPLARDADVANDAASPEPVNVASARDSRDAGELLVLADAGSGEGDKAAHAAASADEALATSTRGIADSNANIRINVYMDRIRQHPLGDQLGQLLKSVYQWREFFAPAALDPVHDIDRIFIYGPQLRDSSQVAAFLQHNVRPARMRRAIDGIIKSSSAGSVWLKGAKNPAARAVADRAQRLFVMYPNHVVAVVPPGAERDALALQEVKLPAPKGDELTRIWVKTPWRALLGTKFQLARSIQAAEIQIYSDPEGGARIEALLEDDSSENAARDARQIKRDVDSVTLATNWLLSGSRVAEPLEITNDEQSHSRYLACDKDAGRANPPNRRSLFDT